MTRADIIRMAKESGWQRVGRNPETGPEFPVLVERLERFAARAAAAEREKVAAWMRARSYATGHGDTIEDLLKELEWQVSERERKACAKLAGPHLDGAIAAAIRARGEV